MARVDIVIPLYNKAHCVGRAIRSIVQQTVTEWRLIVVDDGSTDNGGEIVDAFADDRIELLKQSNQGPGAARNAGISAATSKYIAFLDADDEWYPWYLENTLKAIEQNDVTLVATMYHEWPKKVDMTAYWAKRGVHFGRYSLTGSESPAWVDWLLSYLHVGTTVMLTETARKYDGYYAEDRCMLGEDTTFFLRVGINEAFLVLGPAGVRHHREQSGLSNIAGRPVAPFLKEPKIVLRYCPADKRDLMVRVIDHIALRTAKARARNGFKTEAVGLLKRFPGVRYFPAEYRKCMVTIALSGVMPYWVRLKCAIGPPVRLFVKSVVWKLGLRPKIPEIGAENDKKRS